MTIRQRKEPHKRTGWQFDERIETPFNSVPPILKYISELVIFPNVHQFTMKK